MDDLFISVIVPAYNAERTVDKCVRSIMEQEYRNIEILIVDDGSSDGTTDIVEALIIGDERIRLIRSNHNGVVAARRTGIKAAKGEYITFVDSDDWLDKNSLECLAKNAIESKADITVGCARTVMSDGTVRGGVRRTLPAGIYSGDGLKGLYKKMMYDEENGGEGVVGSVWASLFRKEILEQSALNIPDKVTYGEDAAMMYLSLLNSNVVYLGDDYVYNYYRHVESASTGMRPTAFYEINLFYNFMREEIGAYSSELRLLRQLKLYMCALLRMALDANFPIGILASYELPFSIMNMLNNKKTVIYGAGGVGRSFFTQLKHGNICSELQICDSYLAGNIVDGERIISVEQIPVKDIEYVLIANSDNAAREKMESDLSRLDIPKNKIISFSPKKSDFKWDIVL